MLQTMRKPVQNAFPLPQSARAGSITRGSRDARAQGLLPLWSQALEDRPLAGLHASRSMSPALQARRTVGQSDDLYERAADQTAEQVMRMSDPASPGLSFAPTTQTLQRKCACGGEAGTDEECERCRRKMSALPRRATNSSEPPGVPSVVHEALRSPGQPLDATTRAYMEPRFGHNFAGVRVHTGTKAAESARAIGALAYTVGRNVVFGEGQYAPALAEGKRLLAHELTHVVQQGTKAGNSSQLVLGLENDPAEQQAERLSKSLTTEALLPANSLVHADVPISNTSPEKIQRQGTARVFTPVVDSAVRRYIDGALRSSGGNLYQAWLELAGQRRLSANCYNSSLAAAEHYMYARYLVADTATPYPVVLAMIYGYALVKATTDRVPRASDCPPTPTSEAQRDWAASGATDGLADYYTPAGP